MKQFEPVIVGVAQVSQREDNPSIAQSPIDLMIKAVSQAVLDTGSSKILQSIDSVRVVRGKWGYKNPAQEVAEQLDLARVQTGLTSLGGNLSLIHI